MMCLNWQCIHCWSVNLFLVTWKINIKMFANFCVSLLYPELKLSTICATLLFITLVNIYIGGPVSHNNGMFKIHLCLRLPGAVSMDVLHFAFLRVTQTAPEVTGTENLVTSNLPFLLDSSGMAKMLSKSLVTDSPLLLLLLLLLLY